MSLKPNQKHLLAQLALAFIFIAIAMILLWVVSFRFRDFDERLHASAAPDIATDYDPCGIDRPGDCPLSFTPERSFTVTPTHGGGQIVAWPLDRVCYYEPDGTLGISNAPDCPPTFRLVEPAPIEPWRPFLSPDGFQFAETSSVGIAHQFDLEIICAWNNRGVLLQKDEDAPCPETKP